MMKFVSLWFPPLIWMGIIFYFSSLERVAISERDLLNFFFFKTLHIVEYALLYFLLFRSFYNQKQTKGRFLYPFLVAFFYAMSDEIHQMYVPTREGRIRDVFIDTAGIYLMYIYIKGNLKIMQKLITWAR